MQHNRSLIGPCGCSNQLVVIERNGIEIDYCPQCRGVWLDRGELDKILELEGRFLSSQLQQSRPEQAAPPQAPEPTMQQVPPHLAAPRPVQPYAVPAQPRHVIPGVPAGHYYDYEDYKYYKKMGKKRHKKSLLHSFFDFD
ncbi:MAG: zf-TFIIB domain-containing protein [Fimbriimonadaceae bacterium]|jgi:hypothetical protein|nr:zf-TFIIB domain-containing protein [Fimbriimonadaceae bacterium]